MPCIDCHTHAFPDTLAPRAIGTLAQKAGSSFSDGTIRGLLASMDRAGIDQALICSIATKPAQFDHIMAWSQSVSSARLIPLPSVHPKDPHMIGHVRQLHAAGFPGIKMHPYYQDFTLDDPALFPLHDELSRLGLRHRLPQAAPLRSGKDALAGQRLAGTQAGRHPPGRLG